MGGGVCEPLLLPKCLGWEILGSPNNLKTSLQPACLGVRAGRLHSDSEGVGSPEALGSLPHRPLAVCTGVEVLVRTLALSLLMLDGHWSWQSAEVGGWRGGGGGVGQGAG